MKRRKTLQKARGSVKSSDSDSEKVSRAHNPTPTMTRRKMLREINGRGCEALGSHNNNNSFPGISHFHSTAVGEKKQYLYSGTGSPRCLRFSLLKKTTRQRCVLSLLPHRSSLVCTLPSDSSSPVGGPRCQLFCFHQIINTITSSSRLSVVLFLSQISGHDAQLNHHRHIAPSTAPKKVCRFMMLPFKGGISKKDADP